MNKYKVNENVDCNGTSLIGYVDASYADLVAALGEPVSSCSVDYKVTTEWLLEDENGDPVTLYDYKQTSLYDPRLPSVEEFRTKPRHRWHIGGNDSLDLDGFKAWLEAGIKNAANKKPQLRLV